MSNIHNRIKKARLEKGLSQVQLAEFLSVSTTTIQLWENENVTKATAPRRQRLPVVAKVLGVSASWLQLGDNFIPSEGGIKLAESDDIGKTYQKIMIYELDLTAGKTNPQWILKKGEDPILIRNAWFEYKNLLASDLRAMRIKGKRMSPHLENEDIILIYINDIETVDDEIFAVVYNGRFFI